MGFNFPNAPAVNDSFTPAGGPTFVWDGIAWKGLVQGVPVTVSTGDTPPVSPALGQLWWESDTGNMFIWYSDPDSAQWVQVSGAVSARPTAETRNRIVNGAMQVSQENGDTGGGTAGFFCADQWQAWHSGMTTFSTARLSNVPPAPNRIAITGVKATVAAGDYVFLQQRFEGLKIKDFQWGYAGALPVVLRFEAYATNAGTFSVCIVNGTANNRTYLAPFTLSASTWTTITMVIPGDTTGTWVVDNTYGLGLDFTLAAGSTYVGVNGWQAGGKLASPNQSSGAAVNNDLFVRNVGLYLDPLASGTAPAWTMPDEASELLACQRYWQRCFTSWSGATVVSGNFYTNVPVVTPRTSPSLSGVNVTAGAFPVAVGTLGMNITNSIQESRTANAASGTGIFQSSIVVNARM